jgi:sulfane dehydrogenase subunit SoxC
MNPKQSTRRKFLRDGAALAGLAAGALAAGTASAQTPEYTGEQLPPGTQGPASGQQFDAVYGVRSRYEAAGRLGGVGAFYKGPQGTVIRPYMGSLTPMQNSVGYITPSPLHYYISHGIVPPDIDPKQHRLLVHGMVDRPMVFTMEDIERLPSVSRPHFIECAANTGGARKPPEATAQQTHGYTSCSIWTGVEVSRILEMAGVQKGASWVVVEGAEGQHHSKSIPLWKAMDDCLVAYGQNGEAVRPEQGYPLRFVAAGWEGVNNVKWLRRIKVVDVPYLQERETHQYQDHLYQGKYADDKSRWFNFEMGVKSVITRPSGGQKLPRPGFYEITGLAWSGAGAIRKVEVSTDSGKTWADAKLQDPVLPKAHTRFTFGWTWNGEETVLKSRSTDDKGGVQPTLAELGNIFGVDLDYFKTYGVDDVNAIHPWKVTADGSIYNEPYV